MHFVLHLQQQYFSALNAFDFYFLLVSVLEIEGCHALELVFGCHGSNCAAERASLNRIADERGSQCLGEVQATYELH